MEITTLKCTAPNDNPKWSHCFENAEYIYQGDSLCSKHYTERIESKILNPKSL